MGAGGRDDALALYVHWPFCLAKCPYCDFNSHVAAAVDHGRWCRALLRAMEHHRAATSGRRLASVFFGGGTPSLMAPETVAEVVATARRLWPTSDTVEVTLEANPGAAEAQRFAAFRDAGVNRLSLGVQSFDDAALAFLGRVHDGAAARAALERATALFPRVSLDLIYALPGQGVEDWRRQIETALAYGTSHLAVYQLTIEPGTGFARSGVAPAPEDHALALFDATAEVLDAAGLAAYEVSNHARPGAECRHNLVYWTGGDYLGIGPGAHGRLSANGSTRALRAVPRPDTWLARVEAGGEALLEDIALSRRERIEELLLMGLRLRAGIDRATFAARSGRDIDRAVDAKGLARMVAAGLVECDGAGLRATPAGLRVLDRVIVALAPEDER